MDITLTINSGGSMVVTAAEQETPVNSIDEALQAIKALAEQALSGAGNQAPGADMSVPDGSQPTPDQLRDAQEQGMMQGFKGRQRQMM
jgi:anti-sigma factor ChrR (cupin superfamily)